MLESLTGWNNLVRIARTDWNKSGPRKVSTVLGDDIIQVAEVMEN